MDLNKHVFQYKLSWFIASPNKTTHKPQNKQTVSCILQLCINRQDTQVVRYRCQNAKISTVPHACNSLTHAQAWCSQHFRFVILFLNSSISYNFASCFKTNEQLSIYSILLRKKMEVFAEFRLKVTSSLRKKVKVNICHDSINGWKEKRCWHFNQSNTWQAVFLLMKSSCFVCAIL